MKTYWINHYREFANTYDLCYCENKREESAAIAAGYERITRKEAEGK